MTIYRSKSGLTALKMVDEITAVYGVCYRLDMKLWHHVGDTEPCDPSVDPETLDKMFTRMVETLDRQEFDLSNSMAEIKEEDLR